MKNKRIMTLCLAALMSASVAGCGSTDTAATSAADTTADASAAENTDAAAETADASGEPTHLNIILRGGSYAAPIEEELAAFEAENNCTIDFQELSFDDLHTDIALNAANAEGEYDLVMVDGSWMAEFTEGNVLANLSDLGYSFDDDIIPNTESICMVGEDIYLAPYFGNVTVMLYNKANIEAAGYDAESIATLQDLLDCATKAQANGTNGFAYRGDTPDNIISDFLPILLACGGWVVDDNNQPTVDTDAFHTAMEYYLQLTATGMALSKDDLSAAIDNGSATVAIGWPGWYVPTADSAANYTVSPANMDGTGEAYNTSEYGTWCLGIPSNAPHTELAVRLLTYIMDKDVQRDMVQYGAVPCRYSILQDEEILKDYPQFEQICKALDNGVYRPVIAEWTEFTNILGTEMGNAITGTKDVDTALADAQSQLEALMQ